VTKVSRDAVLTLEFEENLEIDDSIEEKIYSYLSIEMTDQGTDNYSPLAFEIIEIKGRTIQVQLLIEDRLQVSLDETDYLRITL